MSRIAEMEKKYEEMVEKYNSIDLNSSIDYKLKTVEPGCVVDFDIYDLKAKDGYQMKYYYIARDNDTKDLKNVFDIDVMSYDDAQKILGHKESEEVRINNKVYAIKNVFDTLVDFMHRNDQVLSLSDTKKIEKSIETMDAIETINNILYNTKNGISIGNVVEYEINKHSYVSHISNVDINNSPISVLKPSYPLGNELLNHFEGDSFEYVIYGVKNKCQINKVYASLNAYLKENELADELSSIIIPCHIGNVVEYKIGNYDYISLISDKIDPTCPVSILNPESVLAKELLAHYEQDSFTYEINDNTNNCEIIKIYKSLSDYYKANEQDAFIKIKK